jgi:hypothetical protein
MKVYALHCGGDLQDVGIFDEEHPQAGEALYNPYYMYVIAHPRGNVLLDTGAHPTLRTDPRSRLGDMADVFEALLEVDDTVPGWRRRTSASSCSRTCTSTTPAASSICAMHPSTCSRPSSTSRSTARMSRRRSISSTTSTRVSIGGP